MKKILNYLKECQVELKLFMTDKEYRKEGISYLTSPNYLKKVALVLMLAVSHGFTLALIKYIALMNI